MRIAVIGAGPAGMAAAYQLASAGTQVDVFEAGDQVGGMARSLDLWGQRVDLGPHRFFSTDRRVNQLWLEVTAGAYRMVDRLTRIFYGGRFYHYPLRAGNVLWNLGLRDTLHCLGSYCWEQIRPSAPADQEATFESWVVRRFGRKLFETFFKSYSEKLWGIPCDQLDADFAAQRIKKFSLGEAVKSVLGTAKVRHKTLVDRFAYPLRGTGMVYEQMAQRVRQWGGRIHLREPVRRVLHEGRQVHGLEFADGRRADFDHVISTMPLTLMVRGLGEDVPGTVRAAVDSLTFRNTLLVYLHIGATDLFPDQWIYIHSPELRTGRVTNFRNWVRELYGDKQTSILALEYWCNPADPIWREEDHQLIQRATREITATGLIGDAPILDGSVFRIPRCYPVYARGYKHHLAPVEEFLREFRGLTPIGRYGAFKYNNQDHSILMGILAAQNIQSDMGHDLWRVNADSEQYQEAAYISETGLVSASAP
jgi:protoporphyrinogen oxidase